MCHNLAQFIELEEELFKQTVRGSPEMVANLLADCFVEFGRSGGVYDKAEVISSLADEGDTSDSRSADSYQLMSLSADVVLLTYRSQRLEEDGRAVRSLRSSVWKFIENRWQMVFHQGTPARS